MSADFWIGIGLYYTLSTIVSFFWFIDGIESIKTLYWGCPKYIYNHSELNIFGTILSSVFVFVLLPLYYFLYFIYWICHVGRRK